MSKPNNPGKHIPEISGAISRPHLLRKLEEALTHRLILVNAPPGYGKTTLVAEFARNAPYPVAWHTIEERQRDVPNFFAQALAALQPILPNITDLLESVAALEPAELGAIVGDYVREQNVGDFIYVLDDIQHLSSSPASETLLRSLVARLPTTCHIIITGRILPTLPLTQMISQREVFALGQEHLRFTQEEVQQLAKQAQRDDLSPDKLNNLTTWLEGWPAGMVLALHPLPDNIQALMEQLGHNPESMFETMAASMLEAQPPGLRDFLLEASTLHRLSPELCDDVLGLQDSGRWLVQIQARNLFISRVQGGLEYHKLFRNFLQRQLQASHPEHFIELHLKAAHWFKEQNQIEEAFNHYMTAERPELAAPLAEQVARSYFVQGKELTLLAWGEQLREAQADAAALYLSCARVHSDHFEYEKAAMYLALAETGYEQRNDAHGLAEVRLQYATMDLQRGNYQAAYAQAAPLIENPRHESLYGQALKIAGVVHYRLGNLKTAAENLEAALPIHRAEGDKHKLANLLQDLEGVYQRLGRLDDAANCLNEQVGLRRKLGSSSTLALALNNLGYYYQMRGDYHLALQAFEEGLSIISRVPNRRAESYLLWSMGDLQRDRGAFGEAMQYYNRSLEMSDNNELSLQCAVLVSMARLRRWQGRLNEAFGNAQEAAELAAEHQLAMEGMQARAICYVIEAQQGHIVGALSGLEQIANEIQGDSMESAWVNGLCAYVALLAGDKHAAQRYLNTAYEIGQSGSSMQTLVAEIFHTPDLQNFVGEYRLSLSALVDELNHLAEAQTHTTDAADIEMVEIPMAASYTIRVTTFGDVVIRRGREIIPNSMWRSSTARELFLYLLFMGPKKREDICLDFWPNHSSERVRSNFHTTLYRSRHALNGNDALRQAAGHNDAIIYDEYGFYRINDDLEIWCDAKKFCEYLEEAELLSVADPRSEELLRRAVELYRGDFLQSVHHSWADALRTNYEELYIEALIGLGNSVQARRESQAAQEYYRRALEIDPYREDAHRGLMSCYAKQGQRHKVKKHLDTLRDFLQKEIGVEPSGETLRHAENLLR
ncbi:MAG: hypothetical protein D6737_11225 [Chloroflexi bacterium]|nr:MAG: hypothetical protein D6737_11225 [Chloroflexota bacterium]